VIKFQQSAANKRLAKIATTAILLAAASAIQIIESPLPRILPWLKPGLANSLVLYAMLRVSPMSGFFIAFFRSFLSGIFLGTLFSPIHLIAFSGSFFSAIIMFLLVRYLSGAGLSSISISGAIASNLAQLMAVQFLFAGNLSFWFHISIMIWISIPSGIIVAKVTQELLRRTEQHE
jgi:uncharacterized membrane protein